MSTQITAEQIKQSDEGCAQLRVALERARSEEKPALEEQLKDREAQHRALHQAYTAECQQMYMQNVLRRFQ